MIEKVIIGEAEDYATTDIEKVKDFIKERLNLPRENADILILEEDTKNLLDILE